MSAQAKVTFIGHSGFLVETSGHFLVFDYYKGIPSQDLCAMMQGKPVLVFVSHAHGDHYNAEIFNWRDKCHIAEYILSSDIACRQSACYIEPRQRLVRPDWSVETLLSTDQGVAFLVQVDGLSIYHAGDLNWWHWEGEPQEENAAMAQAYKDEIYRLRGRRIDLAFVPVDPRLEEQYFWGLDYFMRSTDTAVAVPMHFWGKQSILARLMQQAETAPYGGRLRLLHSSGDSLSIP